jgi:hypothetical protein
VADGDAEQSNRRKYNYVAHGIAPFRCEIIRLMSAFRKLNFYQSPGLLRPCAS